MITYSKIGHFGRLGNQLFQFASTYGIGRKLGYDIGYPVENVIEPAVEDFKDGVRRWVTFDVPKYFNVPKNMLISRNEMKEQRTVNEPHFHFSNSMFSIQDGTDLIGYYQSEKYFKHVEQELREILKFPTATNLPENSVSIHIRVGDYVGLQQFHPLCSREYYESAVNHFMDDDYTFIVFSDDMKYAKDLFGVQENLIYSEGNNDFTDLTLMASCKHNIIANSSFSWWAAWLNNNPNKRVIAPKKWFGHAYEGIHDTKDLYPETWTIV